MSNFLFVCWYDNRYDKWKLVIGNEVAMFNEKSNWYLNVIDGIDVNYPTIDCGKHFDINQLPSMADYTQCPFDNDGCLFNIDEDPCELENVRYRDDQTKEIYDKLYDMLLSYNQTMVTPLDVIYLPSKTDSNPHLFNGYWTPWMNSDVNNDKVDDINLQELVGYDVRYDYKFNDEIKTNHSFFYNVKHFLTSFSGLLVIFLLVFVSVGLCFVVYYSSQSNYLEKFEYQVIPDIHL